MHNAVWLGQDSFAQSSAHAEQLKDTKYITKRLGQLFPLLTTLTNYSNCILKLTEPETKAGVQQKETEHPTRHRQAGGYVGLKQRTQANKRHCQARR